MRVDERDSERSQRVHDRGARSAESQRLRRAAGAVGGVRLLADFAPREAAAAEHVRAELQAVLRVESAGLRGPVPEEHECDSLCDAREQLRRAGRPVGGFSSRSARCVRSRACRGCSAPR